MQRLTNDGRVAIAVPAFTIISIAVRQLHLLVVEHSRTVAIQYTCASRCKLLPDVVCGAGVRH